MIQSIHCHLTKENVEAVGGYTTDGYRYHETNRAKGTGTGYLVNNGAGYAIGATVINVDTGANTILVDDIVRFNSTAGAYVVTAFTGAPVTQITISPGLLEAIADNLALSVMADSSRSLKSYQNQYASTARLHRDVIRDDVDKSLNLGDLLYGAQDGGDYMKRLAGNNKTTQKVLSQTGTGTASAAPEWGSAFGPAVIANGAALDTSATYTDEAMPLNSESLDSEGTANSGTDQHDTVTNNSRLTARVAGTYIIVGSVSYEYLAHISDLDVRTITSIRLNGSTYLARQTVVGDDTGTGYTAYMYANVAIIAELAIADYVELMVNTSSGSTYLTTPYSFSMVKIAEKD